MTINEYLVKVDYTAERDTSILVCSSSPTEALEVAKHMFHKSYKQERNTINNLTILEEK